MSKLPQYLNQPYPHAHKPWQVVLVASLLVFFVLAIFQPFGIQNLQESRKWLVLLGFTLVTTFVTFTTGYLLPLIFKTYYAADRWTRGKNFAGFLLNLLLIGLGNFALDWSITNRPTSDFVPLLLLYLTVTLLVGIIPMLATAFLVKNQWLKRSLQEADELNRQLAEQAGQVVQPVPSAAVTLTGSTKESLTVQPDNLLYLEALGNYVKVRYRQGDEVKERLLRTTISRVEDELRTYPLLARCHRAFIVNLARVASVSGSAQGYHLAIRGTKDSVPVSRSYTKPIREQLRSLA